MADLSAGRAYIEVVPSLKDFHKKVRSELLASGKDARKAFEEGFGNKGVDVPTPNETPFRESGRRSGDAFAGAFDREVRTKVTAALKSLPDAKIGADASEADREIAQVRASLERLSSQRIGIDIDEATALNRLETLQRKLADIAARGDATVSIKANTAAATAELAKVQASVARLEADDVTIDVDADTAAARAQIAAVGSTSLSSSAGVSNLVAAGIMLGPAIVPAAAAATSAIAGIGTAALSSAAGLGVAFLAFRGIGDAMKEYIKAEEAAGAASEKASRQRQVSARQIETAQRGLARAEQAAADAAKSSARQVADAQRGVIDAKRAMGEAVSAASQRVREAAASLAAAERDAAEASKKAAADVIEARRGVARAEEDAAEASQRAARSVADAQRSLADARLSAAEGVQSAIERVSQAEETHTRAVQDAKVAQESLTAAREDAKRALQDLDMQLRDAALNERQAVLSLERARQRLAEVGKNETDLDRRQEQLDVEKAIANLDEIRVRNARLAEEKKKADAAGIEGSRQVVAANERIAQTQERQEDAAKSLADAQAGVDKAREDGARKVGDAQQRVTDAVAAQAKTQRDNAERIAAAQQRVTDAVAAQTRVARDGAEKIAAAQARLGQAEAGVNKAREDGARRVADAQLRLKDAQEAQAASAVRSAQQVVDAQRNLQRAYSDAADAAGGGTDPKAALADLSPAQAQFATFLLSMRKGLRELTAEAAAGFLPGLERGMRSAGAALAPFRGTISSLSSALGEVSAAAGKALGGPAWQSFFSMMQGSAAKDLKSVASILGNMATGFASLAVAFKPVSDQVIAGLKSLMERFAAFSQGGPGSGLQKFIDYLLVNGPKFAATLGSVVNALAAIVRAVAPFAGPVMAGIKGVADAIAGMKTENLTRLIGVLAGLTLGWKALTVAARTAESVSRTLTILKGVLTKVLGANTAATNLNAAATTRAGVASKAFAFATGLVTKAVNLLKLAWATSPFGVAIIAIAAIGVALKMLWDRHEGFRNAVKAAWAAIQSAISVVKDWIVNVAWPALKGAFEAIAGAMVAAKDGIVGAWDAVKGAFTAAKDWIVGTALPALKDAIGKIASFIPIVAVIQNWDKIKAAFTAAKDWVKDTFSLAWAGVKQIVTNPIDSAKQVVEQLLGATGLRDTFTRVWNWAKGTFSLWWAGVKKIFTDPIDSAKQVVEQLLGMTGLRDIFIRVWNWADGTFRKTWAGVKAILKAPVEAGKEAIDGVLEKVSEAFTAAKEGVAKIWDGLTDALKSPVNAAMSWLDRNFLSKIRSILEAVGLDSLAAKLRVSIVTDGGGPRKTGGTSGLQRASGGPVPGWSPNDKADNIPAWLTAGEYVTRVAATRSMERHHPGALAYINRYGRLPGYAIGGKVGGLNPKFLSALAAFNKAAGGRFSVISGLRTRAEQERLYALYLSGRGNLAAKPGTSRHETGDAADLSPSSARDTHGALAKKFGLHFPVPGEAWHVELIGGGGGGVGSFLKGLAAKVFNEGKSALTALLDRMPSKPSPWMPFGKNVAKHVIDGAFEKFMGGANAMGAGDGSAPSGSYKGGSVEQYRGTVLKALSILGLPSSLANTTLRRMNQESGGNVRAINDWDINARNGVPSKGLMQVIDPTFRAYAHPSYNKNIYDPLSNILASMRYALARYGSLPAAYDRKGGYAGGGLVKPAVFDMGGTLAPGLNLVNNKLGRPEPLVRADLPHPGLDGARFDLVVEDGTVLRAYVRSQASAAARADAAASRSRLSVGGAL